MCYTDFQTFQIYDVWTFDTSVMHPRSKKSGGETVHPEGMIMSD